MPRSLRIAALALLAVLALFAGACGVEGGSALGDSDRSDEPEPVEEPVDEPDTTEPDTTEPDTSDPARQSVIDTYVELGLSEDEAECLTDVLFGSVSGGTDLDNTAIMDAINECDIPMSKLADIGENAGANSVEDGMRFGLETSLRNQGLSDSEAACVADEYIDQFGTDAMAIQDPEALADLLDACGLTPADLGN